MSWSQRRGCPSRPRRSRRCPRSCLPACRGWCGSSQHVGSARAPGPPGGHPGGLAASSAARDAGPQPPHGRGAEDHPGRHGSPEERRGEGAVRAQVRTGLHLPASRPPPPSHGPLPCRARSPPPRPPARPGHRGRRGRSPWSCQSRGGVCVSRRAGARRASSAAGRWPALDASFPPGARPAGRSGSGAEADPGAPRAPFPFPPPPRPGRDWGTESNMAVHRCSRGRPGCRRPGPLARPPGVRAPAAAPRPAPAPAREDARCPRLPRAGRKAAAAAARARGLSAVASRVGVRPPPSSSPSPPAGACTLRSPCQPPCRRLLPRRGPQLGKFYSVCSQSSPPGFVFLPRVGGVKVAARRRFPGGVTSAPGNCPD